MILITKGGLSRGGDNEMPENCLYDCRLRDTCIYVPRWADEETLLRIGTERSKSCPLVQVYEVPTISKMEQVDKDINVRSKDEQTDCTEALTLLWIKNMVTDEEFYRIDARLKVMPQTERSE